MADLPWKFKTISPANFRRLQLRVRKRQTALTFLQIYKHYLQAGDEIMPCRDLAMMSDAFGRCQMMIYELESIEILQEIYK